MQSSWVIVVALGICAILLLLILVSLQSLLSALGNIQNNQVGLSKGIERDLDEIKNQLVEHRSALDDVRSAVEELHER